MISHLATLSEAAQPTPFHNMLQNLDSRGQLLRVYTQNIDALEERAGLSFGIPAFPSRPRKRKVATPPVSGTSSARTQSPSSEPSPVASPPLRAPIPETAHSSALPSPASTPVPAPRLPRCIPLHGTLKNLYCPTCFLTLPLCSPSHLGALSLGNPLSCPQCTELDGTRRLVGKRTRGVARLRPEVVLYNEPHREGDAERVGECVRRDLIGLGSGQLSRAGSSRKKRGGDDLLIVAGTSLRIPGAKRIVREFAKALHPTSQIDVDDDTRVPQVAVKTVYLNLEFPVPAREWDGVFDIWVQGDVQCFARGFENYRAEVERGLADTIQGSSVAQTQPHDFIKMKQTRRQRPNSAYSKLLPEEPSAPSKFMSVTKKPKRRGSFTPEPFAPSSPPPTRAPQQIGVNGRSLHKIPRERMLTPERANSRLTIKIRRPKGEHTPTTATGDPMVPPLQLSQEVHRTTPGVVVEADQRPGRSLIPPEMPKIAT